MIRVKVDGKVLFDGDPGDWESRPPSEFADAIKPGAYISSWMKPMMLALSDAVVTNRNIRVNIVTKSRDEYTMTVKMST